MRDLVNFSELKSTDTNYVIQRNIEALARYRKRQEDQQTSQEKWAIRFTRVIGTMRFVYFHAVVIALWMLYNADLVSGLPIFDPFPFVGLGMLVSCESIFLGTFILISQNRLNELSERRSDLDVQINLLTEYELTQLIRIVDAVALRLGIDTHEITDMHELTQEIPAETVLEKLDAEQAKENI